ncbi:hypothetical protein [Cohnella sp. AR92]|uniref:hypothetical protein n=1 Tax=Cohnella sp. AR92 TaxID=648716 RepID=UPI000F8E3AFE|nr:hypothetical protein [Cohnella sp. AR92]RUS45186.1 hypothetical protein ELR57_19910 [Cohnella sp. AR92]
MKFRFPMHTRRQLLLAGYLALALWAALEWTSTHYVHTILSPVVFVSYISSFTACTIMSVVLYFHRPGKWLCEDKLASLLLLAPLVWSLL